MLPDQTVLRVDHVVVVVLRKPRAQAVRRLARLAGTDGVREDDVVAAGVQWLSGAKKLAGERGCEHGGARPGRAVQDEDRLAGWRAHGRVVKTQLRQNLPGVKTEIAHHPVAFLRRGVIGGQTGYGSQRECQATHRPDKCPDQLHVGLLRAWRYSDYHGGRARGLLDHAVCHREASHGPVFHLVLFGRPSSYTVARASAILSSNRTCLS